MFWALDDCYYSGQVVSYKADSNTHVIQYDDGHQETLNLRKRRWRWSSCNTSSSSSSSSSSSLALSNGVTHDRKEQQANAPWARSQKAMAVRRPERLGSKNGRGHACAVCAKIFSRKSHLTVHMRTHTGDKPYVCVECGRRFSQKSSLTTHMRTHTGDKPYACLECGKKYISGSSLTKHMKTHMQPAPASSVVGRKRKRHTSAPQLPRVRPS